jgi:hypothetical protein
MLYLCAESSGMVECGKATEEEGEFVAVSLCDAGGLWNSSVAVTQLTDPSYSADPIYRQISGHVLAIMPKNPTFM